MGSEYTGSTKLAARNSASQAPGDSHGHVWVGPEHLPCEKFPNSRPLTPTQLCFLEAWEGQWGQGTGRGEDAEPGDQAPYFFNGVPSFSPALSILSSPGWKVSSMDCKAHQAFLYLDVLVKLRQTIDYKMYLSSRDVKAETCVLESTKQGFFYVCNAHQRHLTALRGIFLPPSA